jgi:two-component system, probable response regulator PhcQ
MSTPTPGNPDPKAATPATPPVPSAATPPAAAPFAVLYVDDEEQALKYFQKAFRTAFPVLTATSVDAAIQVLEAEHARVAIVLSDHRMPGRTGVELLTDVKQRWPHITRILVTAYADMESAIAAVNSGAVFKYLTKPIDFAQTKVVLAHAMKSFADARDREAAHAEREGMIERMIVADRVRSLARMATGVSHHVRNSLTAMSCFFEEMADKAAAAKAADKATDAAGGEGNAHGAQDAYLDELLQLANKERERLVGMINAVEARGVRPSFAFAAGIDPADLAANAVAATITLVAAERKVTVDIPSKLATLTADADAVTRMIGTLIVRASHYAPQGSSVRVTADGPRPYWNTSGIRVRVLAEGAAWPEADVAAFFTPFALMSKDPGDVGLELLDAFQVALGHEGDIVAHRAPPAGPGFEVWLPLDPAAVRRPALVDGKLALPPTPGAAAAAAVVVPGANAAGAGPAAAVA